MMKETNIHSQVTSTIAGDDGEAVAKSEVNAKKKVPEKPNEGLEKPADAGWYVAVVRVNCETRIADSIRINLNLNNTYYVFELDDEGNPITDTSQEVKVNKLPYVVDYKVKGNSTNKAVAGDEVIVTNSLRTKMLPSAGSRLTLVYRQLGLVMVVASFIVLLIIYKNRVKEKEEEIGK